MKQESEVYLIKTKVMLDQDWFNQFRINVGAAMRIARARAELIEEIHSSPRFKETYSKMFGNIEDLEVPETHPEPEWFRNSIPTALALIPTDPALAEVHRQAFVMAQERHSNFANEVRLEIGRRGTLRQPFINALSNRGLNRLLEEHFEGL
jgi:hypothetical protein